MAEHIEIGACKVDKRLHDLVRDEITPGTGIDPGAFWTSFGEIVRDLEPKNRHLLEKRDALQSRIDAWHLKRKGQAIDKDEYRAFLEEIGYLVPEGDGFEISTTKVDSGIAEVAGPQLVVPVDNARYALNAANALWGSLYDALYGTDVIPEDDGAERGTEYNPVRGAKVVARAETFLDQHVGLATGSHADVVEFLLVHD